MANTILSVLMRPVVIGAMAMTFASLAEPVMHPGLNEPWRFKDKLHAIHLAAYSGNKLVLRRLLQAGASCDEVRHP
jgi:hypothetical protein